MPVASDFGYLATGLPVNAGSRVVLRYPKWTLALAEFSLQPFQRRGDCGDIGFGGRR